MRPDEIKDARAAVNATTEQMKAAAWDRIWSMPADDLYELARKVGVEPTDYVLDDLAKAVFEAMDA
jgi:hypothetical protein